MTTGIHAVFRGPNLFLQRRNWGNWHSVKACRQCHNIILKDRESVCVQSNHVARLSDILNAPGAVPNNSHGLIWAINTQAQPTTKHESNLKTYWDFHIKYCLLSLILIIRVVFCLYNSHGLIWAINTQA